MTWGYHMTDGYFDAIILFGQIFKFSSFSCWTCSHSYSAFQQQLGDVIVAILVLQLDQGPIALYFSNKLHTKLQFRINGHKVTEEENFISIKICAARFYSSQTNLVWNNQIESMTYTTLTLWQKDGTLENFRLRCLIIFLDALTVLLKSIRNTSNSSSDVCSRHTARYQTSSTCTARRSLTLTFKLLSSWWLLWLSDFISLRHAAFFMENNLLRLQ